MPQGTQKGLTLGEAVMTWWHSSPVLCIQAPLPHTHTTVPLSPSCSLLLLSPTWHTPVCMSTAVTHFTVSNRHFEISSFTYVTVPCLSASPCWFSNFSLGQEASYTRTPLIHSFLCLNGAIPSASCTNPKV